MTPHDFGQRMDRLRADLVEQGRRVQGILESSFDAIFSRNATRADAINAMDDVIDHADVELEKASVALLTDATRAGAELDAVQLRSVLTVVKVNNELERIADVAVDLVLLIPGLAAESTPFPDTFRVMANSVVGIARDTTTSVARNDPNLANIVLQSQHAVTAFKDALMRDVEQRISKGQMKVDFGFHLHEMANLCELAADHCTNIAEQVIYLTTGGIVRHTQNQWVQVPPKA
jgi:phosphate transport system protein